MFRDNGTHFYVSRRNKKSIPGKIVNLISFQNFHYVSACSNVNQIATNTPYTPYWQCDAFQSFQCFPFSLCQAMCDVVWCGAAQLRQFATTGAGILNIERTSDHMMKLIETLAYRRYLRLFWAGWQPSMLFLGGYGCREGDRSFDFGGVVVCPSLS